MHNQSKKFKLTSEWSVKNIYSAKYTYTNTFSTDLLFSFGFFLVLCPANFTVLLSMVFCFFDRFILNFPFRFAAFIRQHNFFPVIASIFPHVNVFGSCSCFIVNSVDAHQIDNLDRRFGKRFNDRHRLYERAIIGFKTSYSQINSKADTKKGASQHNFYMSSTKYCRPNIPLCKAQA